MKKITYMLVVVTMMLFLGNGLFPKALRQNTAGYSNKENKTALNIITTTKVQYYMVKSIVKDMHNVEFLLDDERELTNLKPDNHLFKRIRDKDLFIFTGLSYEPWINVVREKLDSSDIRFVDMSRGIKPIYYECGSQNNYNPYYILDFELYKIALYNIKISIQDKDPENREIYEENYNKSINDIKKILDKKKVELYGFKNFQIVTDTDVFDYFFKGLGLNVIKINSGDDIKNIDENQGEERSIFVLDKDHSNILNDENIKNQHSVIQLYRYDENKSFPEIISHNIDIILENLKKNNLNS